MKKRNSYLNYFLVTLLLLSFISSFAQSDYFKGKVTLLDGRVLEGFVKDGSDASNTSFCLFKETLQSESKKYSPKEIRGYQIEDRKIYSSFKIKPAEGDSIQKLLQTLVGGEMNLFFLREGGVNHYYVKYPGKRLTEIMGENRVVVNNTTYATEGNFKNELKAGYGKCPQAIEKLKFYQGDLMKSVKGFNECTAVNNQTFFYRKPKNDIYVGGRIGYSSVHVRGNTPSYYTLGNSFSSSFGLFAKSQVNQLHKRVFFQIGAEYVNSKIDYDNSSNLSSGPPVIEASVTFIQIPLILSFDILSSRLTPYVFIGGFHTFSLSSSVTANQYSSFFDSETFTNNDTGILEGIGLKYAASRSHFFIEGRNQTIHHTPNTTISRGFADGDYLTFSLGYGLKLGH